MHLILLFYCDWGVGCGKGICHVAENVIKQAKPQRADVFPELFFFPFFLPFFFCISAVKRVSAAASVTVW